MPATARAITWGGTAALMLAAAAITAPPVQADAQAARRAEAALPMPVPPRPPDRRVLAHVFGAVALGDWDKAYALAKRHGDPVLGKAISWIRFSTPGETAGFAEITAFIEANPDWPAMRALRVNAEEAITDRDSPAGVADWLTRYPPLTVKGARRLADVLMDRGQRDRARALIRKTWVEGNFSRGMERRFYRRYRKLLTAEDHVRRLDRLLWDGRSWEARRMLRRVKADQRAVAVARLRLRRFRGGVDWAIRQIPDELLDHPGFVYERLRWRRRKGRDNAVELLEGLPRTLPRPELWWTERGTLARRALRDGKVTMAYRLASDHRQTEAEGASFADAEWLSGWIALRFLDEPRTALGHFTRMYEGVNYPISRARGAYWAGRAAEAMDRRAAARRWYHTAARHFTTFYGQLAIGRLPGHNHRPMPPEPEVTPEAAESFWSREIVRAAEFLAMSHERDHLTAFVEHLALNAEKPAGFALTAQLALDSGRADLALDVAKAALRRGVHLMRAGWPRWPLARARNGVETPFVLALMRQESAFDPGAVSWAGARGLMQLMPATARRVARRLNLPFSRSRLLEDPHYNVRIGTTYLAQVLEQFEGSKILGLAAYNAGPARARRWLREFGDFRTDEVDPVDWIEMIPFDQTRDYVQRVIENLHVYRALRDGGRIAASEPADLLR